MVAEDNLWLDLVGAMDVRSIRNRRNYIKYAARGIRDNAAQPSTIEFYERHPLQEFAMSTRKSHPCPP